MIPCPSYIQYNLQPVGESSPQDQVLLRNLPSHTPSVFNRSDYELCSKSCGLIHMYETGAILLIQYSLLDTCFTLQENMRQPGAKLEKR